MCWFYHTSAYHKTGGKQISWTNLMNRWETNLHKITAWIHMVIWTISYGFLWFHAVSDQFHGPFYYGPGGPIRGQWLVSCFIAWTSWGRKTRPSINGLRENLQENMVKPHETWWNVWVSCKHFQPIHCLTWISTGSKSIGTHGICVYEPQDVAIQP